MSSIQLADVRVIASGIGFAEGPVALPDGSVLCTDIREQCLVRVRPDGRGGWQAPERAASVPGGPNGAAIGPDGAVYVANNGGCFEFAERGGFTVPGAIPSAWTGGSIDRVDLLTGERTVLTTTSAGRPLRAPNDLVFDADGGLWFTDHGTRTDDRADRTAIHFLPIGADGSPTSPCTEVVRPVDGPNGIGLSPDGRTVYWAETHTGRVFQRSITGRGTVAPSDRTSMLCGLPGMQLLDSLAVDGDGRVCVATIVAGGITAVDPDTGASQHYSLGAERFDPLTTNICFGGPDLRTAFVTCSGRGELVSCTWPTKGLALHFADRARC